MTAALYILAGMGVACFLLVVAALIQSSGRDTLSTASDTPGGMLVGYKGEDFVEYFKSLKYSDKPFNKGLYKRVSIIEDVMLPTAPRSHTNPPSPPRTPPGRVVVE